jgi:hypothetical protein
MPAYHKSQNKRRQKGKNNFPVPAEKVTDIMFQRMNRYHRL